MDTYTLVVLWNNGKRQEALEMADKDRESSRKLRSPNLKERAEP